MLDTMTKSDLGIQRGWKKFESFKKMFRKKYFNKHARSLDEDYPDPAERLELYENELEKINVKH